VHRALLNAVSGHLYVGALNRAYLEHYGVRNAVCSSSRTWWATDGSRRVRRPPDSKPLACGRNWGSV
jgi:hypothetical protein